MEHEGDCLNGKVKEKKMVKLNANPHFPLSSTEMGPRTRENLLQKMKLLFYLFLHFE